MYKVFKERLIYKKQENLKNKVLDILKKEDGSFTVEATAVSVIVILVLVCMIVYGFLLYDKNKVHSVINESVEYCCENENINDSNINNYIQEQLNNKLYVSEVKSVSSSLNKDKKINIKVNIDTNSSIYSIANTLINKKYTITCECNSNCIDIADKVREK